MEDDGDKASWGEAAPASTRWPFMLRMVAGLTAFFLLASLAQLVYLQSRMLAPPDVSLQRSFSILEVGDPATPEERLAMFNAHAALALESGAVQKRYHQANMQLMARVWMRYLGFLTGMTIALVGSAFILGQLQGAESTVQAGQGPAQVSVTSASPGVILVTLGVALMVTTLMARHLVQITDTAVYIEPWSVEAVPLGSGERAAQPPPLDPRE